MDPTPDARSSALRGPCWRPMASAALAIGALAILVLVFASPAFAPPPGFPDVPANHPYRAAILDLAGRGIINGYTNGSYGPDDSVRRQQFAKMIVLTAGYPVTEADVCLFTDVQDSGPGSLFPENFVAVAAAHQITVGTAPGLFSPGAQISRYQVVTMVVRAADSLAPGLLAQPLGSFTSAPDWGDSPTHSPNARRAEFNGLLAGLPLASLDPWGDMSRGEVAQVLHNLLSLLPASTTTTEDPNPHFQDLGAIGNYGGFASAPAAAAVGSDNIRLFAVSGNGALWESAGPFGSGGWSGWSSLGGSFAGDPTAVSWGTEYWAVFARGTDGALHCFEAATSSGWTSLGGTFVSNPCAVVPAPGRLVVLARGADDHLYSNLGIAGAELIWSGRQTRWQGH